MTKIIRIFIAAGLLQFYVGLISAQGLSTSQERLFNLNALRLIEDYENNAPLSSYEQLSDFCGLFENDTVLIYNDLLGVSSKKMLTVKEYTSLLKAKSKYPKVIVKNVKKGIIYEDDKNWLMDITFDKEVSYTDACDVLLSSKEYYGHDYDMKAVIAMDKESGQCSIRSLTGSNPSNKPLLTDQYAVVLYNDPRDKKVLCNGERLEFNSFDQAIVASNPMLTYYDADANMRIVRQPGSCEVYSLKFRPRHMRVKLYGSMSLGDFYKQSGNNAQLSMKSSETSMGLDIGYVFPTKGIVKLGAFIGAGYSMSKLDLGIKQLNYNYSASSAADMDGDTYNRFYELSDVNQTIKINSLVIPVYADIDFRVASSFSIYTQVGVKGYMTMSNSIDEMSANAYVYGVYPQYENLRIDETWLNAFGEKTITNNSSSDDFEVKSFSYDAFGGLGLRVNLVGPLLLDCGIQYQFGLSDCISNTGETANILSGTVTEQNALVSYTVASGEKMRSITDAFSSAKRQALKFNVGLMFKF